MVRRILRDGRTLAVTLLGDDEQISLGASDLHAEHLGVCRRVHAAHAHGAAAHGADLVLGPHDCLAGGRHHDDVLALSNTAHADKAVAVLEVDRDKAVTARTVVLLHGRLLHHAVLGGEHEVLVGREVLRRDDGADGLALFKRQQVHDSSAARVTGRLGKLVDLQTVHLALRGEEQHEGVRGCNEQVLDVVVILQVHRLHALAATLLLAVRGNGQALDVAGLRDRDHHALLGDEVFDVQVLGSIGELRFARSGELLLDLLQLLLDDVAHQLRVGEHAVVVRDLLAQLFQLGLDLLALQTGQAA